MSGTKLVGKLWSCETISVVNLMFIGPCIILVAGPGGSSVLILLAGCQQTCMTYTSAVCTVKNCWWWTGELSETCESFIPKNKFEKSVHLVDFITRTCVVSARAAVRYVIRHRHSVPSVPSLQALQFPRNNCRGKGMNERNKASKKWRSKIFRLTIPFMNWRLPSAGTSP